MTFDQGAGAMQSYISKAEVLILLILLGLHVTWPTSYEALVGRAELKAG